MAKRTNPFVEDYVPQSKVHVGIKQFNNNEVRIQKVYEKTLEMLFKGAKKSSTSESVEDIENTPCKDKMKQLFIGKDGSLLHSGIVMQGKKSSKGKCACGGGVELQCAYCEQSLCAGCEHHCTFCDKAYCSKCALTGSESSEVCVSCYG